MLTHTGRSIGDRASERVAEDVMAAVHLDALLLAVDEQEGWCRTHGFPASQLDTVDIRALLAHGRRSTVEERVEAQRR